MNLDRAYENTAFIEGGSSYPARWKSQAEAFRIGHSARARLDQRYGEGRRHLYDLFLPEGAAKGLLVFIPDGSYEVKSFAADEGRQNVSAYGVFSGTHTGEGGPCPPTGKRTAADYVYVMQFSGGKISHMTKIWNSGWTLKELGWM